MKSLARIKVFEDELSRPEVVCKSPVEYASNAVAAKDQEGPLRLLSSI